MSIQLDMVQDSQVRHDLGGVTVTRQARLTGITGAPERRGRNALLFPGMPKYGDPHPAFAALRVVDIVLSPVDVETWDATITYRDPSTSELVHMVPGGSIVERQWFAVTVTEQRNTDIRGGRMYHWYRGNPLTPTFSSLTGQFLRFTRRTGQFVWKNETAEVQTPSVGVRVIESSFNDISARIGFAGTVNSDRWSGYPPKTWLLAGLDSRDDRGRWINTYELLYKPDSWQFESIVEWFGAPPDDAQEGNGIARFDVYPEQAFSGLGFTI